ncbi:MAG: nucleotidyltransferase/DNA polymerase protein [Candidatus Kaiserbacteria bacterium]|nr:nucleotidyltransferase/DNA polymerase protein [Candidatus Kaiserbacteria bacterium]
MSWGHVSEYKRAIIHVDGDSFFASCEVAKNPTLRGKPVITGRERGIVSACTYEAKAFGVTTGMKLKQARELCPDAIVVPSDYETYSIFSHRMYAIVRRYTPQVEEYSIDECFAEITGTRRMQHMSYENIAAAIQADLTRELGMTFSIGLSCTKVLAKIGSKYKKPNGLTNIPFSKTAEYLKDLPVGYVWGIGPNTASLLNLHGIKTALQFVNRSEVWVTSTLTKPTIDIWRELRGEFVNELDTAGKQTYQSLSKTRTFTPPSTDLSYVFSQLSKNVENACIKLRRWNLAASEISFFLKTQEFTYQHVRIPLIIPTCVPQDIIKALGKDFVRIARPNTLYRATGITMSHLTDAHHIQLDLFGAASQTQSVQQIYDQVDALSERYGKHAVFLGSSLKAMQQDLHLGERGDIPTRVSTLFKGETARRRLGIPFLGVV